MALTGHFQGQHGPHPSQNDRCNGGFTLHGTETVLIYLPAATKLGQGNVFTGICDSVHRGGGLPQCMLGYPPGLPGPDPPRPDPPGPDPPREADASIRSMSGRYASYWNAFLYAEMFTGNGTGTIGNNGPGPCP